MKNTAQPPSGLLLMLKAMGINLDPNMFSDVKGAVIEVRDRLRRIEEKLDRMQPVCLLCGEKTAHVCKPENVPEQFGEGVSAVIPIKENQPHATDRS